MRKNGIAVLRYKFGSLYIINTHLIQYTCNTKILSSVSDKCTVYMDATSKLNCLCFMAIKLTQRTFSKKVQVGKDQEKAQSEKDSHSKNRGGKKPN